jgi:hypothetical protein
MKLLVILLLSTFTFVACGIKGDPVPPTKPFDWGQNKDKSKKKTPEENQQ